MKNKLTQILLSVFVAMALWLFVITTVSPGSKQTYYDIPVVMSNESVLMERGLMITNIFDSAVTMELSGNRSDLSKVNRGNITLKVDLSTIYEPGAKIGLTYTTTFPGDVASNAFVVESKKPGRINVTVEHRIYKTVPVEVKWIGSAPEGFIADRENRVLEIPVVQIAGPQSSIEQIEKAVIEVDLNDQRESISQDFDYILCNAEGEPVDPALISSNVNQIHLDVKIQRVKDIRLAYTLVEGGGATADNVDIQLSVESIRVSGSEAALEMMGDQLVVGTINLAEITADTYKIFTIPLEEGISNLTGVTEVQADISMKGLNTKDFLIQVITPINVPAGLEVELFTRELMLRVRGPVDEIAKLRGMDVYVVVDFTNAEIGTSTFRVDVSFADGFEHIGTLKVDSVSASVTAIGAQTETGESEEAVG